MDEKLLERFSLIAGVPTDLRSEILAAGSERVLPAGSIVFLSGEACRNIPFVIEGQLTIVLSGVTGRELPIDRVEAGSVCALSLNCALCRIRYPADCRSPVATRLLCLPARVFQALMDRDDGVRKTALEVSSRYVLRLTALLEEVAFARMDQRMARVLLRRCADSPRPDVVDITHERLAAELGSSREVISRILKTLEHKGTLALQRGRIHLRDKRALWAAVRSTSRD